MIKKNSFNQRGFLILIVQKTVFFTFVVNAGLAQVDNFYPTHVWIEVTFF